MNIIWFLVIGGIAGWLAGLLMKGGGSGIVGNIIVGVIGAFIGGFILDKMDIGGEFGPLITAFIGACILLFVLSLIKGGSKGGGDS